MLWLQYSFLSVLFCKNTYVLTWIGLTYVVYYIMNDGVELSKPTKFCQGFNSHKLNYTEEGCSLKCSFFCPLHSLFLSSRYHGYCISCIVCALPEYIATIISAFWTISFSGYFHSYSKQEFCYHFALFWISPDGRGRD